MDDKKSKMENIQCNKCNHTNQTNAKYCSSCGYELPNQVVPNNDDKVYLESNKRKIDKKKIIGIIVGSIVFVLSYFAVQQLFFKAPSLDKVMMQVASEINSTCPIMIDEETRLDNAISLPDNIFQYNYTLINWTKSEVSIDTLRKYLEPSIISNIKTNPDLVFFRDNKITMAYYYKNKNGEFVHKFSVTPDQYEND